MKLSICLFVLVLSNSFASQAETTSSSSCQFNIETGKFFDLSAFPSDQRLSAYQQYVKDLQAKKYVSKPCPPKGEQTSPPADGPNSGQKNKETPITR